MDHHGGEEHERRGRDPACWRDLPHQRTAVLERAAGARFDLLVVDAFSSDAVPVHLLTRDALATYLSKLRPHGVMAFNITNRYLNLEPVLGNLAVDAGLRRKRRRRDRARRRLADYRRSARDPARASRRWWSTCPHG